MFMLETGTGLVPVSKVFNSSLTLLISDWSFCCHVTNLCWANCFWRSWSCLELWQRTSRLATVQKTPWRFVSRKVSHANFTNVGVPPETLTCCPSLSAELVLDPAPEQKAGTCSPAKLDAPLCACVPALRDDVVRFQIWCPLRAHPLTKLLFH